MNSTSIASDDNYYNTSNGSVLSHAIFPLLFLLIKSSIAATF